MKKENFSSSMRGFVTAIIAVVLVVLMVGCTEAWSDVLEGTEQPGTGTEEGVKIIEKVIDHTPETKPNFLSDISNVQAKGTFYNSPFDRSYIAPYSVRVDVGSVRGVITGLKFDELVEGQRGFTPVILDKNWTVDPDSTLVENKDLQDYYRAQLHRSRYVVANSSIEIFRRSSQAYTMLDGQAVYYAESKFNEYNFVTDEEGKNWTLLKKYQEEVKEEILNIIKLQFDAVSKRTDEGIIKDGEPSTQPVVDEMAVEKEFIVLENGGEVLAGYKYKVEYYQISDDSYIYIITKIAVYSDGENEREVEVDTFEKVLTAKATFEYSQEIFEIASRGEASQYTVNEVKVLEEKTRTEDDFKITNLKREWLLSSNSTEAYIKVITEEESAIFVDGEKEISSPEASFEIDFVAGTITDKDYTHNSVAGTLLNSPFTAKGEFYEEKGNDARKIGTPSLQFFIAAGNPEPGIKEEGYDDKWSKKDDKTYTFTEEKYVIYDDNTKEIVNRFSIDVEVSAVFEAPTGDMIEIFDLSEIPTPKLVLAKGTAVKVNETAEGYAMSRTDVHNIILDGNNGKITVTFPESVYSAESKRTVKGPEWTTSVAAQVTNSRDEANKRSISTQTIASTAVFGANDNRSGKDGVITYFIQDKEEVTYTISESLKEFMANNSVVNSYTDFLWTYSDNTFKTDRIEKSLPHSGIAPDALRIEVKSFGVTFSSEDHSTNSSPSGLIINNTLTSTYKVAVDAVNANEKVASFIFKALYQTGEFEYEGERYSLAAPVTTQRLDKNIAESAVQEVVIGTRDFDRITYTFTNYREMQKESKSQDLLSIPSTVRLNLDLEVYDAIKGHLVRFVIRMKSLDAYNKLQIVDLVEYKNGYLMYVNGVEKAFVRHSEMSTNQKGEINTVVLAGPEGAYPGHFNITKEGYAQFIGNAIDGNSYERKGILSLLGLTESSFNVNYTVSADGRTITGEGGTLVLSNRGNQYTK